MASLAELETLFEQHIGAHELAKGREAFTLPEILPRFESVPPNILIILFASRSGSTYACQLLANSPYFNQIRESFNAARLADYRQRNSLADDCAAVQWAINSFGTERAFAAKCGVPGMVGTLYTGFLPAMLDRITFLTLRRRDRIAQAVSLTKAQLSGQYHSTAKTSAGIGPDDYDKQRIAHNLGQIRAADRKLQKLVDALPNLNHQVYYEDIVADPAGFVNTTLGLMDLPPTQQPATNVRVNILRDDISQEWCDRFAADVQARQLRYLRCARPLPPKKAEHFERPGRIGDYARKITRRPPTSRESFLRLLARYRGTAKVKSICRATPVLSTGGFDAPANIVCLLGVPRSGIEETAKLLSRTPYFSRLGEILSAQQLCSLRDTAGLADCRAAAQLAIDLHGTSAAFGIRGSFDMLVCAAHIGFLHEMIERIAFIRVQRRDEIEQAVLLYRHQLARSAAPGDAIEPGNTGYNRSKISEIATMVADQSVQLDQFLGRIGKQTATLWLEDEINDPVAFTDKLCALSGLPQPKAGGFATESYSANDHLVADWTRRFKTGE